MRTKLIWKSETAHYAPFVIIVYELIILAHAVSALLYFEHKDVRLENCLVGLVARNSGESSIVVIVEAYVGREARTYAYSGVPGNEWVVEDVQDASLYPSDEIVSTVRFTYRGKLVHAVSATDSVVYIATIDGMYPIDVCVIG